MPLAPEARRTEWETDDLNTLADTVALKTGSTLTGSLFVTRVVKDDFGAGAWGDQSSFLSLRRNMANLSGSQNSPINVQVRALGTRTVSDRVNSIYCYSADSVSVTNKTVTNAANNGSGLIRITAVAHGYATNDRIGVYGIGGTTEANGSWGITKIDADNFDLVGSTFTNAYTSGGTATNRPMMYGVTSVVDLGVARGSLTGTAINAADVACFVGINNSSGQSTATEAFYLGRNSAIFTSIPEWQGGFSCVAYVQYWGFGAGAGRIAAGGAFFDASRITYDATSYPLAIQNTQWIRSIDQAQTNPQNLIRCNSSFQVELGAVKRNTTGETVGFTAGGGTTVTDASTFTGNVGATAYRISDIVKHLKNMGVIAT